MSSTNNNGLIWSPEHGKYYYYTIGADGQQISQWVNQTAGSSGSQPITSNNQGQVAHGTYTNPSVHVRTDSVSNYDANMAPPAPVDVRTSVRFKGTPERGWYETLDTRYRMRTRAEAHKFFIQGRVFSMLWTETASATMARNGTENTAITIGKFGQGVYSQIRRFVVMKVNRKSHFVYACAISTYGNQGTMKYGCTASEHTIVHLTGTQATYIQGEWEKGMTKDPIEIVAAEETETMHTASRLRLGKIHSIEWNVKVREIGQVAGKHMSKLMRYYKEEENNGFDNDDAYMSEDDDETTTNSAPTTAVIYTQPNHTQAYYAPYQNS